MLRGDSALLGSCSTSLQIDGFEIVHDLLDDSMLSRLRAYCDRRLAAEDPSHFSRFSYHGSMLALDPLSEEVVADLVSWPRAISALQERGFDDPRWLSAYLISKPPHSPPLWWHQDWWAWDEPVSHAPFPPQMFIMYYLSDVDQRNGALRVIPGSHRIDHPLARVLPDAHGREIGEQGLESPAHRRQPDEITVSLGAGSAVLGDVRLLHATHPNTSSARRTCLTLWYLPMWRHLPESVRSSVVGHPALPPRGWWKQSEHGIDDRVARLLPRYDGSAAPATYRRNPRLRGQASGRSSATSG